MCTELVEPGGRCSRCDDELTLRVWLADHHGMPNLTAEELLTVCLVLATDPGTSTPKVVREAAKRLRFPALDKPKGLVR